MRIEKSKRKKTQINKEREGGEIQQVGKKHMQSNAFIALLRANRNENLIDNK